MRRRSLARPRRALGGAALLLALAAGPGVLAQPLGGQPGRRTTPQELAIEVERYELPNGLVVLLAPDPTTTSVLVWTTFRAGALYEPPGKSGLAHLVEHILASGPTPETSYDALLEARGARSFNAVTGFDVLAFESVVPAEELPAALWVAADRLGTLPGLIDAPLVERHRRVVVQEHAQRYTDEPYGLIGEQLRDRLYAPPHPLYGGAIGTLAELGSAGLDDVRGYIAERLGPANAVLTVVGRFDPQVAKALVADGLGRLPAGRRATCPRLAPLATGVSERLHERISREPRVSIGWRFPDIPPDHTRALQLGAQLLTLLVDGAWGMRISSGCLEYPGETSCFMDLTLPYDESVAAAQNDADGFLRMLTLRQMPDDFMLNANRALDLAALFRLDTLSGRAAVLTRLELSGEGAANAAASLGQHWDMPVDLVRDTARIYLQRPRVVVHARPVRPRPAKIAREDLE